MIYIDERTLNRVRSMLNGMPEEIRQAHSNALDSAIDMMKTTACNEASRVFYITNERVAKTIKVKRGNRTALSSKMVSRGAGIPLIDYRVSPNRFSGIQAPFYSSAVKRQSKLEPLNRSESKKPFLLKRRDGHLGIYRRLGATRYSVAQLWGPSVPKMLGNQEVRDKIERAGELELYRKLESEVQRILERNIVL